MAFKKGDRAFITKDWDMAVEHYRKAIQSDPTNPRYRLSLSKALIEASNSHTERGGEFLDQNELKLALVEYQKALDLNPENSRAKKGKSELLRKIEQDRMKSAEKTEIEKIKERAKRKPMEKPMLGPSSETLINLKFKDADLKQIFETLQKVSGINILFDESFKSKNASIDFLNITFKEAMERLLLVSGLFYKVIDEESIIIVPDTPAKRKDYEDLMLRTFYLSNADVNQVQSLLRTLAEIKTIAVNPDLNTISIREPQERIEIAEKIIASQDKSKAELLIDVEILEVNKSRMAEYGIELDNYQVTQSFVSGTGSETSSSVRGNMLRAIDFSNFLFSIPSVTYKLLMSDTKSKIIAKPQLRVVDGEKVSIKLGDKVPVPVTTFVPIAAGGPSQQAITSYQMYDVGINIDVTPRIHHNGDITLKLKFELTFITVPGTATMPPTIGNRSVETIIRMKDNETGLLAGLLRDSERKSWRGIPGISRIPILRYLFGGTGKEISQADIIFTMTPRITRMPDITEEDLRSLWLGTQKDIGLKSPLASTPFEAQKAQAEEEREEKPKERKIPEEKTNAEQAIISFDPSMTEVPAGVEFIEKVTVENAENIGSLVLTLTFDPALVRVKDVKEESFMSPDKVKTSFLKTFNNTSGEIQVGISREGFGKGASGTGEIVSIIFESIKEGRTAIAIASGNLRTPLSAEVPAYFQKAEVTVKRERGNFSKAKAYSYMN